LGREDVRQRFIFLAEFVRTSPVEKQNVSVDTLR
jgi:hypothetical protein